MLLFARGMRSTEAKAGFGLRRQPARNAPAMKFLIGIVGYGEANALLSAYAGKPLRELLCATPASLTECCPLLSLASARRVASMFERTQSEDQLLG